MKWRFLLTVIAWKRGFLHGILLGDWLRLLWENRRTLQWAYWRRMAAITIGSAFNTIMHCVEMFRYGHRIRTAKCYPPVFVLGVWRSGTTLLYDLLAVDSRFAYPNYLQVNNPNTFLSAQGFIAKIMAPGFSKTRVFDNMRNGSHIAGEDEFALLNLTLRSCYLGTAFPRNRKHYNRYLTFRGASQKERARWKAGLKYFVQKLSFQYERPLILKSPPHIGRIRMILDVFPDAKFVCIRRNPFEIFQSNVHMLKTILPALTLQALTQQDDPKEYTIQVIKELNAAFVEDRDLIPKGNYCELSFESLTDDPLGQMRRVYQTLALPDFEAVEPHLRRYLASIADYKKNKFVELPADLRARIVKEWSRCFEEGGYSTE